MKPHRMLFSMVWMLCVVPAAAQVTITDTDVAAYLKAGNTIVNYKDTLTTSLDIGAPGATSWDFSGLFPHTNMVLTSLLPASTPFASLVPGATHALKTTITGPYPGVPGTVDADVYLYYQLGSVLERPSTLAGGTLHLGPPFNLDLPAELYDLYVPMDTTYALPLTLGTTWTSTYTDTTILLISGGRFQTTYVSHVQTYTVDAFGLMRLPNQVLYHALRIKKVESGPSPYTAYVFITKEGASVTVSAADQGQPTSGVIQIYRNSITWNLPANTALPVQLSYFHAARTPGDGAVVLTWATVSEVNNFGFEVERRNGSTGDFSKLPDAFIKGNGTSVTPHSYSYTDLGAGPGFWYYRLKQIDLDGTFRYSEPVSVFVATGIDMQGLPLTTSLEQNYPNPFNGISDIGFRIADFGRVKLQVIDLLGREVAVLVNEAMGPGSYRVRWDAGSLSSGVYLCRLDASGRTLLRRMLLVR